MIENQKPITESEKPPKKPDPPKIIILREDKDPRTSERRGR